MNIIAAVDLSPASTSAARSAAKLAAKIGDRLLLVRTLEPFATSMPELAMVGAPDVEQALRRGSTEALTQLSAELASEGCPIEIRVLMGPPSTTIAKLAADEGARLIVTGTHGRGASARLILGSVAQRLVTEAPCPVLVLREGATPFDEWAAGKRPLRIVLGVDRSASTDAAVGWISILRQAGPCDVLMVHDYWPPQEYTRLGLRGPRDLAETDPEVVSILTRELGDRLSGSMPDASNHLRIRANWGPIGDGLAQDAESEHADLLVLGTHQPHGWERLKLGSTAIGALHATHLPVLCVPTAAAATVKAPPVARLPVIRTVLVATDLSEIGNAAVAHGYALLQAEGGTVELCHVHAHALPSPAFVFPAVAPSLTPQERADIEAKLRTLVPAPAEALGIRTTINLVDGGEAAEAILQASRRLGADVIVVASHGRGGARRAVLGSVAESVVRASERPVYVVRATQEA